MKKKLLILLIVLFSFMLIPVNTNASKNDKINVYLFRGKGCPHCQEFLNFLNSINDEYGDMYELVSYEVWNNSDNNELMKTISAFLEQPAQGVPYIIIGKTVIPGYVSSLDSDIKSAIKDLYETSKSKRYDVFTEYEKTNKLTKKYKSSNLEDTLKDEGIEYNDPKKSSSNGTSSKSVIIWNLVFTAISASAILVFINAKFKKINENIDSQLTKLNKPAKK